jgi:hypothetical protein
MTSAKRKNFYEFLRDLPPSPTPLSDLAADVRSDEKAPRGTARLIDYLNRRNIDADLLAEALDLWRKERRP